MRFYDEVTISVQSGKWWDGAVTWRREAWVPYGWPSWGDGGKWGSIILQSSKDENTLVKYKFRKNFKAKPGENGRPRDQYWADAEDVTLPVPVGTVIKDKLSWAVLHIFSKDQETFKIVQWWEWWLWNIHFKDAVHQYPNYCLLWEPWHQKEIVLELQLLADVSLIWTPSVGKSSIINSVSNTKAKVAEYPFTTLIPNLWSVQYLDETFNIIDIPWLIKWAAEWRWLWNAFLRHVLKSRVFCFVLDIARYDQWINDIQDLLLEIVDYLHAKFDVDQTEITSQKDMITFFAYKDGEVVIEKRVVFMINKFDMVNDLDIVKEYKSIVFENINKFIKSKKIWKALDKKLLEENTFTVSAITRYGLEDRLKKLVYVLKNTSVQEVYHIPELEIHNPVSDELSTRDITDQDKEFLIENWYIDEWMAKYTQIREIKDFELCKLVRMIPRWNDEAEQRFRKALEQKWMLTIFENLWIRKWDILKIISYYDWKEDRYIQR